MSALMKRINSALRRNRKILYDLNPKGNTVVSLRRLTAAGFDFDIYTSSSIQKDGKMYYFCYEQGYSHIEDEMVFLFIKSLK